MFKDKYPDLHKAIWDRLIDWKNITVNLAMRTRFIKNYLLDFSVLGYTDENKVLRRYRFQDMMSRIEQDFGSGFANQSYEVAGEFLQRVGENKSKEDWLRYQDVNVPEARRAYNKLVMKAVKNEPTFKFTDYIGDIGTQMFSKSLNFYLQRMLKIGEFFDKTYLEMEQNVVATGMGYLRLDYDIAFKGSVLDDRIFFKFVPDYEVFDDGRYVSDTFYELEESKFVAQMYRLDRETAEKMIAKFKRNIELKGVLSSTDEINYNALWDRYGIEKWKTILILEVFWKEYDSEKSEGYRWRRTYFAELGSTLEELITLPAEDEYACGLPIIRLKHELTTGTIFGYTPNFNNINIDAFKNRQLSMMAHAAMRNAAQKTVVSNKLLNAKDINGRYWHPYLDQTFGVSNLLLGQAVTNHIQTIQNPPQSAEALNLINQIQVENARTYDVPAQNVSRMSYKTLAAYYSQENEIFEPMLLSRKVFMSELGIKLYQILRKEYGELERASIKSVFGAVAEGIDLKLFDIDDKLPAEIANAGITVSMSSEEEVLKAKTMDLLLPILDRVGVEALSNEAVIQLFDLRNIGFALPFDKEKMYVLKDIYMLKTGKVEDPEDLVLKTVNRIAWQELPTEQQAMLIDQGETAETYIPQEKVDYNIQNHQLAVDVIKQWMNENKYEFAEMDEEIQNRLYRFLDEHQKGLAQSQQLAQGMAAQQSAEQVNPEQVQQLMAQMGQQAPVQA